VIGEAWLIAFGLSGTLLFLAGVLHVPITGITAVVGVVIGVAGSVVIARRPSKPKSEAPGTRTAMVVTLIPIAVILYAAAFIPPSRLRRPGILAAESERHRSRSRHRRAVLSEAGGSTIRTMTTRCWSHSIAPWCFCSATPTTTRTYAGSMS